MADKKHRPLYTINRGKQLKRWTDEIKEDLTLTNDDKK